MAALAEIPEPEGPLPAIERPPFERHGRMFATDKIIPDVPFSGHPAYLDYVRYRYRMDATFDVAPGLAAMEHYLNWYITHYRRRPGQAPRAAQRRGDRPPERAGDHGRAGLRPEPDHVVAPAGPAGHGWPGSTCRTATPTSISSGGPTKRRGAPLRGLPRPRPVRRPDAQRASRPARRCLSAERLSRTVPPRGAAAALSRYRQRPRPPDAGAGGDGHGGAAARPAALPARPHGGDACWSGTAAGARISNASSPACWARPRRACPAPASEAALRAGGLRPAQPPLHHPHPRRPPAGGGGAAPARPRPRPAPRCS